MGCRGQVQIKPDNVFLYTHWGASVLPETVKVALSKKWRWDDSEYLARIIFDVMTDGAKDETGFGIGAAQHNDIETLVVVDCDEQTVTVDCSMFGGAKGPPIPFEQFIG